MAPDLRPLFYMMGALAVGLVLTAGAAIARWHTVAELRGQNQALVLKLAEANKQSLKLSRMHADSLAAIQRTAYYNDQCSADLKLARGQLEAARADIGPCPTNCGSLDCRQVEAVLQGLVMCREFLGKAGRITDSLGTHLGPGPAVTAP